MSEYTQGASNIGPTAGLEISDNASIEPPGLIEPKVRWAKKQIASAMPAVNKWVKQAKEADRYEAGHFFTKADRAKLQQEGRPDAAFNTAQKFMRFVSGLERVARRAIRFLPRVVEDMAHALEGDLMTKIFEWVISLCSGDDERSRAFADMTRRGMGWTDVWLNRFDEPDGVITVTRIDGLEMIWDTRSRAVNLEDAQWVARRRKMAKEIAKKRWPKHILAIETYSSTSSFSWDDIATDEQPEVLKNLRNMQNPFETSGAQGDKNEIDLIEFQWWEEVRGAYYADPFTGKMSWMASDEFETFRKRYALLKLNNVINDKLPDEIDFDEIMTRRYRRMMFMGDTILAGPDDLPGKRFTYNCMTGAWDGEEKLWYGMMRLLMDPQRYLTKFINLVMEIVSKQSKGGLLAERDAFENPLEAEQMWARTGSVIHLKEGGLAKVQEKTAPQLPQGVLELFKICAEMNEQVTGISPAVAMGMMNSGGAGNQPAMTFRHRQVANLALLAMEFAALDRYRMREAKTIVDFLPYVSDGRLARVGGQYDSQVITLTRDPLSIDYDLVLDEQAERDPNVREMYMQFIMQMAPTLLRTDNFLPELLDFLPLPVRVRESLKKSMADQAQAKAALAQQGLGSARGGSPLEIKARAGKLDADKELAKAKAIALLKNTDTNRMKVILDSLAAAAQPPPQPMGGGGPPGMMTGR